MDRNKAYTDLLLRYRNMLWGLCWQRSGGDRDRCCDLLQEVSIALWENFGKLRPNSTPEQEQAWVRWQAHSVFYKMGRRQELSTEPLPDNLSATLADEDSQQRKELLEELLSSLDPDDQRMMRLYLKGYRGDEIGREMGISRDNFYQRMRRIIQKMRSVALLLLALLFASTVAIAFVPQWRHFVFGGGEPEKTVTDTLSGNTDVVPEVIPLPDTVPPAPRIRKDTLPARAPVEHMPSLNLLETMSILDEFPTHEEHDSINISVDGSHLIIIGAEGEWVKVYDYGGRLVASEMASRICIIDLFPSTNNLVKKRFRLQIGNRQPLQLEL